MRRIGFYFAPDVYWSVELSIKKHLKKDLVSLFQ